MNEIFTELIQSATEKISPIAVTGAPDNVRARLVSCIPATSHKLVITHSPIAARNLCDELKSIDGEENVLLFPNAELLFYDVEATGREAATERLAALDALARADEPLTIIATIDAVLSATLPIELYRKFTTEIKIGDNLDLPELCETLAAIGYSREEMVEGKGQFSLRGGILDVFLPNSELPFRVEFFDTEVESIRIFDIDSQLTVEKIDTCRITPAVEIVLSTEQRAEFEERGYTLSRSLTKYIPLIYGEKLPSLLDYLGNPTIFLDDSARISESAENLERATAETVAEMLERGVIPTFVGANRVRPSKDAEHPRANTVRPYNYIAKYADTMRRILENQVIAMSDFLAATPDFEPAKLIEIDFTGSDEFHGKSEREIFGVINKEHSRKLAARKRGRNKGNKIDSFTDLSIGDFVVHQNHGIGEYIGIKTDTVLGVTRDYIQIKYKGDDMLLVPSEQLDRVYKYIGKDGANVKVNKLGGTEWSRAKQRVRIACADMAKELVELYAAREQVQGIQFSPDNEFQQQFDESFPYEETDDQLISIDEVKRDMQSRRPMDRLLCGDVGYGKTEVALRAAFKAVLDGYQVAYLAPTTILANQHYNTFCKRMKEFAGSVEMLSRFRTPTEQKNIIKKLKSGEIDVIIGTHRLLSKDIEFKKLGLLIVDEEQRFGVSHKERIKEVRKEVDVLTLTATPIPRTLHMSMVGIRDMSVIHQPPKNRHPVGTCVLEYDEQVIKDAISREIGRGGQVFYLSNRVDGIFSVANKIAELVPGIRVGVGHGKMSEQQLENVMHDLHDGEIDVLVCTTIIETGLDVPNVNTIIIENADRMGLSQLYQLRGRVGRSNRLAYAYLTFQRDKVLTEVAEKRLRAIREFTEFGSGFKIALRDLEIRGAGNIIGSEQHGHMDSVGYDLYCKLLAEATNEARGIESPKNADTQVNITVNAFIPDKYITAHHLRISAYKRIAIIETEQDLADTLEELRDRFGAVPDSVRNLAQVALIKNLASKLKITEILCRESYIMFNFSPENPPDMQKIVDFMDEFPLKLELNLKAKTPNFRYKLARGKDKDEEYINKIKIFLQKAFQLGNNSV